MVNGAVKGLLLVVLLVASASVVLAGTVPVGQWCESDNECLQPGAHEDEPGFCTEEYDIPLGSTSRGICCSTDRHETTHFTTPGGILPYNPEITNSYRCGNACQCASNRCWLGFCVQGASTVDQICIDDSMCVSNVCAFGKCCLGVDPALVPTRVLVEDYLREAYTSRVADLYPDITEGSNSAAKQKIRDYMENLGNVAISLNIDELMDSGNGYLTCADANGDPRIFEAIDRCFSSQLDNEQNIKITHRTATETETNGLTAGLNDLVFSRRVFYGFILDLRNSQVNPSPDDLRFFLAKEDALKIKENNFANSVTPRQRAALSNMYMERMMAGNRIRTVIPQLLTGRSDALNAFNLLKFYDVGKTGITGAFVTSFKLGSNAYSLQQDAIRGVANENPTHPEDGRIVAIKESLRLMSNFRTVGDDHRGRGAFFNTAKSLENIVREVRYERTAPDADISESDIATITAFTFNAALREADNRAGRVDSVAYPVKGYDPATFGYPSWVRVFHGDIPYDIDPSLHMGSDWRNGPCSKFLPLLPVRSDDPIGEGILQ